MFQKIQVWADKKFARGIARAMKISYAIAKETSPDASEEDILKTVLSARPTRAAEELIANNVFWDEAKNITLKNVVLMIVTHEYRHGYYKKNLLHIPHDSMRTLSEEIFHVLN